jgi:hypothetical protein
MTTPIIAREPVLIIADLLQSELGLSDSAVMLSYEKINISTDPGLYIVLDYVSGKAIGNNNYFDSDAIKEVQQVAMNHLIQIDLMSFDDSARTRKEEVIMALRSIAAQQAQDANAMQIARIPGEFINTASLENTKFLNRFTMTIVVKSIYTKTKTPQYYDTFSNVNLVDDTMAKDQKMEVVTNGQN